MLFIAVAGFIVLIGLGISAGMIYGAVRARKRIATIQGAVLCEADQLRSGMAKMRGRIMAIDERDLLVSPLSRTTCVFFKFVVEERRTRTVSTGKGGTRTETYWVPVITDVQAVPCTVRDSTGDAVIDLAEAEIVLSHGQQTQSGMFNSASAGLERRLNDLYGFSSRGLIFNKSLRYTEMVIEEGVKVFVVGEVRVRKNGEAVFRKGREPLLVTDKNEKGLVSHYRWRSFWFTLGAIMIPLLFLTCGGVFGGIGYVHTRAFDESASSRPGNNQGGTNPWPNQPAAPRDAISKAIKEMGDPTDKWVRVRAAWDLFRLPVQPARRDEVAQAINPLLLDPDENVRGAGIAAAGKWGTQRHNGAALRNLAATGGVLERQSAANALATLGP
jgi:hypothetical protein